MRRGTTVFALAVALLAITVVAVPGAASLDDERQSVESTNAVISDEHISECTAEPPDDFADPDGDEVIGWVDGFWYNEGLSLDTTDGLNDTELANLGARTTARVEAIRCLDAINGTPPIEVQTREEFQDEQSGLYGNVSKKDRLSDNAVFETMMMISSQNDSIDIREQNRGATVGGFYSPTENRIVMVSDDPDNLLIEEYVLAQEVGHAIQDQQFNLTDLDRSTTDIDSGINGLIEGDMNLVDQRYLEACENDLWGESCVSETQGESESSGGGQPANWGKYFQSFQPYSDGPAFVQSLYQQEGWDAVNELYEEPPKSALYTVFPETYPDVEPTEVEVTDQSNDEWERLTWEDSKDYDTLGVASIASMFIAPTAESGGAVNIYNPQNILNDEEGPAASPYNYAHPETEGWRGDRIYTYRNGEESGTVWQLDWASAEDGEPFVSTYKELIELRGGTAVDGYKHTYTFEDSDEWNLAVTIVPDGSTVTVVTAPTVDDLTAIHDIELVESEQTDGDDGTDSGDGSDNEDSAGSEDGNNTETETETETPTEDGSDGGSSADGGDSTETESNATEPDSTDADDDGAGFGIVVGAVAVLMTTLVVRRRRN
ncbi:Hvo_1808 family surface protein [Halovenus rubra]|uniref:Hvo_1808 family surface protein n=2 Tax=Halovenus rubra TaxID=869890 RepID=A0ACC7E522_9EURY|nr:Hvo_1808 family surface protein [Halovenus rubra]